MRLKYIVPAAMVVAFAGCDSVLDVKPANEVASETAIVTPNDARSALAGLYDALQSTSYYGGNFVLFMDLSSDNALHSGTFTTFADADGNNLTPDNTTIEGIWDSMYRTIGRANTLIERVPGVTLLSAAERDDILGQAYAIRALTYHNLAKVWGTDGGLGVPLRTTTPTSLADASSITRSTQAQVYTQILADLAQARALISNTNPTRATRGFVRALYARVYQYQSNWTAARDSAAAVIAAYTLAPTFAALFTAEGTRTTEDIFRVAFTDQESMNLGFYYLTRGLGGRREQSPTANLNSSFETGDARRATTVALSGSTRYSLKWPTPVGAEDFHVMRLAEVILIKAEAHARLNGVGDLAAAVTEYNKVRVRAGLAPHVFGVNVITQTDVLSAVLRERRSELALEGDRWPDLLRRGDLLTIMAAHIAPRVFAPHQALYPIPQNEIDVAIGLKQNPGY